MGHQRAMGHWPESCAHSSQRHCFLPPSRMDGARVRACTSPLAGAPVTRLQPL